MIKTKHFYYIAHAENVTKCTFQQATFDAVCLLKSKDLKSRAESLRLSQGFFKGLIASTITCLFFVTISIVTAFNLHSRSIHFSSALFGNHYALNKCTSLHSRRKVQACVNAVVARKRYGQRSVQFWHVLSYHRFISVFQY